MPDRTDPKSRSAKAHSARADEEAAELAHGAALSVEPGEDALFPGFEVGRMRAAQTSIHYRKGGDGPPLLLLHGFPQTGALWAEVAARLKDRFTVIVPDLRGYGRSRGPVGEANYSKRVMAGDFIRLMGALGHDRFLLAGHDRGGRVGYRLALDHPESVIRFAALDILPTSAYWRRFESRAFAMKVYHWTLLAQPYPVPEKLIGGAPEFFVDRCLTDWSAQKDISYLDERALEIYRAAARDPATLRAMCDDYRAGAGVDVEHDEADQAAGRKIQCPMLALWGGAGIAQSAATPLDAWKEWCAGPLEGEPLDCGHFLPEEKPAETAAKLAAFFTG